MNRALKFITYSNNCIPLSQTASKKVEQQFCDYWLGPSSPTNRSSRPLALYFYDENNKNKTNMVRRHRSRSSDGGETGSGFLKYGALASLVAAGGYAASRTPEQKKQWKQKGSSLIRQHVLPALGDAGAGEPAELQTPLTDSEKEKMELQEAALKKQIEDLNARVKDTERDIETEREKAKHDPANAGVSAHEKGLRGQLMILERDLRILQGKYTDLQDSHRKLASQQSLPPIRNPITKNSKFVVYGFFTKDHESKATRLIQSLEPLGFDLVDGGPKNGYELRSKHPSNCSLVMLQRVLTVDISISETGSDSIDNSKAVLINKALHHYKLPILYVDSDVIFHSDPSILFNDLVKYYPNLDIGVYNNPTVCAWNYPLCDGKGKETQQYIISGFVQFYNYTAAASRFLQICTDGLLVLKSFRLRIDDNEVVSAILNNRPLPVIDGSIPIDIGELQKYAAITRGLDKMHVIFHPDVMATRDHSVAAYWYSRRDNSCQSVKVPAMHYSKLLKSTNAQIISDKLPALQSYKEMHEEQLAIINQKIAKIYATDF